MLRLQMHKLCLLTQPLIVEGNTALKITSSTTDSFDIAISYLNIQKERLD